VFSSLMQKSQDANTLLQKDEDVPPLSM